jgi:hypothetical protein
VFDNDIKERQSKSFPQMGNLKYIRARDIDPMDLVEAPSSQLFAVALELSRQCLSKLENYVEIKTEYDHVLGH